MSLASLRGVNKRALIRATSRVFLFRNVIHPEISKNESNLQKNFRRGQHNQSVFMHHTTSGSGINKASVTLGLIHSLMVLKPGVGYFRPIERSNPGQERTRLVKEIYKLPGELSEMRGVTQEKAIALVSQDRIDDLIDEIIKAYENYKAQHDFVVIEGSGLSHGSSASALNGSIAAALGSPALLLTDVISAAGEPSSSHGAVDWESEEWEKLALNSIIEHEMSLKREHVDILGSLVYRVPPVSRGTSLLAKLLEDRNISFAGAIPMDPILAEVQVHDIKRILSADLLFGQETTALSTEVTGSLVATLQLDDILALLPRQQGPSKGTLVLTHVSRPDILLGLLAANDSHFGGNIAAIVLTGGGQLSENVETIVKERLSPSPVPVLISNLPTFETCVVLSEAKPEMETDSARKIERAQVLFEDNVDMEVLQRALFQEREVRMNPKLFRFSLFQRAKQARMHIVLPEGSEPRTLTAAAEVVRRGLAQLTLLGDKDQILTKAKQLRIDLAGLTILDPASSEEAAKLEKYAELVYEARKHKGMTLEEARLRLPSDLNLLGTAMVASGDAQGMVSGAIHTTADTVRPALQVIKTQPSTPIVSSVFFMCLPDKVLVYGDCAINTDPSSEDLAAIAISSAQTAAAFGMEPRVAMLSYATGDSNQGPLIQKVADATKLAQEKVPGLLIEGPLQYDAAVNPETARTKMKGRESPVAGKANVLIFPDLNTGNNTYKAVQQSTGAIAMGPLLQGLRKPVNDLSRGCTVEDIVTTIALTAVQAHGMEQSHVE